MTQKIERDIRRFLKANADKAIVKKYGIYFKEGYDPYGVAFETVDSNIDRAPLGNMPRTLIGILIRDQAFDLRYRHCVTNARQTRAFEFDTVEIKQALGDVPLTYPDVREWLNEFITEGEHSVVCQHG